MLYQGEIPEAQTHTPLVKKVAVCVDDIRLAKFVLDESHDMRQIRLAHIISVRYSRHLLGRRGGVGAWSCAGVKNRKVLYI